FKGAARGARVTGRAESLAVSRTIAAISEADTNRSAAAHEEERRNRPAVQHPSLPAVLATEKGGFVSHAGVNQYLIVEHSRAIVARLFQLSSHMFELLYWPISPVPSALPQVKLAIDVKPCQSRVLILAKAEL